MFDIHQPIHDGDGEINESRLEPYINGLMAEFADSPEARPIIEKYGNLNWAAFLLEYAANYLGTTPPEMSKGEFQEVVFDLFPRKVSTGPETAPEVIAELQAFWTFLHRQYQLANAPQILATLDHNAAARLREKLADPRNWGMAKSFFMKGAQAGYDMTNQQGLDEYLAVCNGGGALLEPIPDEDEGFDFDDLPPLPAPLTGERKKQKRQQRKAQRQARKRNRKK
jgi:hypothetical protein